MGTRHLYWILTGPSFAVQTPSQKKYRKKYKQRSSNFKLKHFSVGKSLFCLPLTSDKTGKCPKNSQYFSELACNSSSYTNHIPTHTEQIYTETWFPGLAHQENILMFIHYWNCYQSHLFLIMVVLVLSLELLQRGQKRQKRGKFILMHCKT